MQPCDALVIGGGPAGATAAILLAQAGWSVVLVERKEFPRRKVCGEYLSATNWPLLDALGLAEAFAEQAGPPVREVAVYSGHRQVRAGLPPAGTGGRQWGRALRRERLDTLLVQRASECGVDVRQPARCTAVVRQTRGFDCTVSQEHGSDAATFEIPARTVIAAHGSWDVGPLDTQRQSAAAGATDWVAFKAHFLRGGLPTACMPLLSFPDGYGGMVHCDDGRTTLSCCIRSHRLRRLDRRSGESAGEAVYQYILETCPSVRAVLDSAERDGGWLSAGSIQPGIRSRYRDGVYVVGNAAGEAHPVVAEGISMAMQSAWLLARQLIPARARLSNRAALDDVARSYSQAWQRSFAPRIRAAAAIAQWASRPVLTEVSLPVVRAVPALLTLGARLSGKAQRTVGI